MDLEDYARQGRALYADFARAVASIVGAAINDAGGFKMQQVQARAKEVDSLRDKLIDRKLPLNIDVTELRDLAGCRAIFYTNTDVERFLSSGLVEANFDVIERRLHHPHRETDAASDLYMANHYVVRLTDARASLPEYRRFSGVKCELQIQTILNHSWAATAHDTIYKAPELERFGTKALKGIEDRLARIAKKYLVPAGYEFDRVFHDFERLLQGKALLDDKALEEILRASDNNERLAALETFGDNVLPLYDDVQAIFPEIVRTLVEAVTIAKHTEPILRETPFGSLPPTTPADILTKTADILTPYRYVDVDVVFSALHQLWLVAETDEERKPLYSLAQAVAKHDLAVWKKYGPAAQDKIVNVISQLPLDERIAIAPLVAKLLAEVLSAEVQGTTSSYATITIHTGATSASPLLQSVRSRALDILDELESRDLTAKHRRHIQNALLAATRPPMQGGYGHELSQIIMTDSKRVLEILTRRIGTLPFDERQALEARVHRVFRMYSVLRPDFAQHESLVQAQADFRQTALKFRDAANADPEFDLYKVLVGYQSVYPAAWERDGFDWRADRSYREERAAALLDSVDPEDADVWFERLSRFAGTESRDLATFPVLGEFLNRLAERQPAMILDWVQRDGILITKFLPGMLLGLIRSDRRNKTDELVRCWVNQGIHLSGIASYLRWADPFDESLLRQTLERAVQHADDGAIYNCIEAAFRQFERNAGDLIGGVFVPAVRALAAANDSGWVTRAWLDSPLLKALNKDQASIVLDALVPHVRLEDDAEYVVAAVAQRWPERVLKFFTDRQLHKRVAEADRYYDAIPFDAQQLREPLAKDPVLVLSTARQWYEEWPQSFQYDGGKLISSTFPRLSDGLAPKLEDLVAQDPTFVLAVLGSYEGISEIYPVVRKVLIGTERSSELFRQAHSTLDESGVVSGEFGFADLQAERRGLLSSWLEDESQTVRDFANERLEYLNRRELAETRRAEASIAAGKLAFGEDLATDDAVLPAKNAPDASGREDEAPNAV